MMYSKLFSSLVHSSLWSEPDHIRLLFITLLAIADRDGIVYGSRNGLERAAMIDPAASEEINPWEALMSPDKDSSDLMRNPENEGRRIEEIPGGFRIINYGYYKSLRDSEDRKQQNREAQRKHREKVSPRKPASATVSHGKPIESKIEIEKESKNQSEEIYKAFPLKVGKPDALRAIKRALSKTSFDDLLRKTKAFAAARNGDHAFCPNPSTWFNQERFNDDPETWKPKANTSTVKLKQPAPIYPTLPPKREPTEDEWKAQRKIVREASEQFKQQQNR